MTAIAVIYYALYAGQRERTAEIIYETGIISLRNDT
jgi:hypothetical protein